MTSASQKVTNLISLASRQAWPHLLVWKAIEPSSVFLIHSNNAEESQAPAQNLQRLFKCYDVKCKRERIPHDQYTEIFAAFDRIAATHGFTHGNSLLNITGGNKLMALAGFEWARSHSIPCCYLERDNRLFAFRFTNGQVASSAQVLDPHSTDDLDPLDLVRCQLGGAEIERPGELLLIRHINTCTYRVPVVRLRA